MGSSTLLPAVIAASVLLIATVGFGAFHTWPYGFWYWAFHLVWKRHYRIERFWPEEVEPSESVHRLSTRLRAWVIEISWFSLALVLPLSLAVDGVLHLFGIFYSVGLSFFTVYDTYLQVVGVGALSASVVILAWADSYLARYLYGTPPEKRRLVKLGPYKHVRHPVYLCFILFGVGVLLLSLSYLMLATLVLLSYLAHFYQSVEERALQQTYGTEYEQYKTITGGFFPRVFKRHA